jgi:hypothetical protein
LIVSCSNLTVNSRFSPLAGFIREKSGFKGCALKMTPVWTTSNSITTTKIVSAMKASEPDTRDRTRPVTARISLAPPTTLGAATTASAAARPISTAISGPDTQA